MEENMNIPETAEEVVAEEKQEKKEKKLIKQDKKLLAEIEELKAAIAVMEDKYLRMAAEYENFRRRSREEKDATYENAMAAFETEHGVTGITYEDACAIMEGLSAAVTTAQENVRLAEVAVTDAQAVIDAVNKNIEDTNANITTALPS